MCYYSAMNARGSEQKVMSVSKHLNFQISFWDFGSKKDLILRAGFFSWLLLILMQNYAYLLSIKSTLLSFIKIFQNTLRPGNFSDRNVRLEGQLFGSEILTFQELITGKYPYLTLTDLLYSWDGMAGRSQVILWTVHAFKKEQILWSCGNSLKPVRCSTQEYKLRFSKTGARVAACLYIYQHKEMSQL